jgi:hypothetical protein
MPGLNQLDSKQGNQPMETVTLTIEQALTALECCANDVTASEFSQPEYVDVGLMRFYLQRAELMQRLKTAINAAQE